MPAPRQACWIGLAVVLYAAALGCRENAILWPAVILAGECLSAASLRGSWRRRDTWLPYVVLVATALAYLGLRSVMLSGAALPPRPYVVPPTAPDFVRFILDKLAYYLLGEFFAAPIVPIGGLPFLRDHPLLFYGVAGPLALGLLVLVWRQRRQRTARLGLAWLVACMLPVLPAFESPHHLYLPGIGCVLLLAALWEWAAPAPRTLETTDEAAAQAGKPAPPHRVRRLIPAGLAVLGVAGGASVSFEYSHVALAAAEEVEDQVAAELAATPDLRDGDTLYAVNLPMLAHYAQLAVEDLTGRRNLHVVPLTWSPRLLGMVSPAELTWVDEQTIDVRIADDAYFAGPLGRMVAEATGQTVAERLAQPLVRDDFTVTCLDGDATGIRALRFRFARPLSSPGLHLYWGSRVRWACPVRFEWERHGP